MMADPEFVIVRRFRYLQDADLAKSALESAGFECAFRDDVTIGMNWGWSNALGGVKLMVRKEDADGARQLLDQEISAKFNVEGVGEFEQPRCPQCQSLDISFAEFDKAVAYTFVISAPVPLSSRQRECQSCGHRWEESNEGPGQKEP